MRAPEATMQDRATEEWPSADEGHEESSRPAQVLSLTLRAAFVLLALLQLFH